MSFKDTLLHVWHKFVKLSTLFFYLRLVICIFYVTSSYFCLVFSHTPMSYCELKLWFELLVLAGRQKDPCTALRSVVSTRTSPQRAAVGARCAALPHAATANRPCSAWPSLKSRTSLWVADIVIMRTWVSICEKLADVSRSAEAGCAQSKADAAQQELRAGQSFHVSRRQRERQGTFVLSLSHY